MKPRLTERRERKSQGELNPTPRRFKEKLFGIWVWGRIRRRSD